MYKTLRFKPTRGTFILLILLYVIANTSFAQTTTNTTIRGIVKDSVTLEPIPFVTIQFDGTNLGVFSDDNGTFKLSNRNNSTTVTISFIGYKNKTFKIPAGRVTETEILLQPDNQVLNEVIVRPKKEKYSKKDNPAVELIKRVIAHKKDYQVSNKDHYQYKEYEKIFFAFNEFEPEQPQFKRYEFIPKYIDTSLIDNKLILPLSVREKISEVYYRKQPKSTKKIVKGYHIEGVDKTFDTEGLDAMIKETFKDISIFDNSITFLLNEFVSPLSETNAVNFYRWYLSDTIKIDDERFVTLDFAPFNSQDLGFTGSLYIALDGSYAVRRAILRAPHKMNINFINEIFIQHDFKKVAPDLWIPTEERMAMDVSMVDLAKFYVDKTKTYEDFVFNMPISPLYELDGSEIHEKDYLKRDKVFWANQRPENHKKDYRMDEMIEDARKDPFLRLLIDGGSIISTGYFPTTRDPEQSKLDIGTIPTFFSYNPVEGARLRLTLSTTHNLHPHLFLYGYAAYGTRDERFKYYAEATWAFNKVEKHKDEYPKKNLTIAYKYDMNNLGQRFTQAERDNILMSLRVNNNEKLTYNRQTQISYEKEYYGGFSFKISGQTFDETPAGNLVFKKMNEEGYIYVVNNIKTTEATLALRYAFNEKFFQQRRRRFSMPAPKTVLNLSHTTSFENVLGGQYDYNKTSFSIYKDLWLAPYGKFALSMQAEKIWGEIPFPLLITPNANNSYTIQNGSFYLISPLEFVHDSQVSWEIYYQMRGWLLNRIPLINRLKLREVFAFRGFIGTLSDRNNPQYNRELLLFPQTTYTTVSGTPYMEYNVGIDNILKMFRIDYVRRITYLDHPNVNKDGFRITFGLAF